MAEKKKSGAAPAEGVTYTRPRRPEQGGQEVVPGSNDFRKPHKGSPEPDHEFGYAECIFCDNIHASTVVEPGRFVHSCSVCRAQWFTSGGVLRPPVKEAVFEKDFALGQSAGAFDKDDEALKREGPKES